MGEEEDASRVKGGGQSGARGLVSRLRNAPLQPVGPRSRSWLSVLGGLSESVMQTHAAGKVVTRNGGAARSEMFSLVSVLFTPVVVS